MGKPRGCCQHTPGIVSHITVLSDRVEDVSSLEAWKKSFIQDGMTDEQKAIAIWTTVVKFRQQASPPNEFRKARSTSMTRSRISTSTVMAQCCCASAHIEQLPAMRASRRGARISATACPRSGMANMAHV